MPASMRVKIIGIATTIVKLIEKAQCQSTKNFQCQRRNIIRPYGIVRYPGAKDECHHVNEE